MKIAQAILTRVFGGVKRYAVELSRTFCERGHEVLAVSRKDTYCAALLSEIPKIRHCPLSVLPLLGTRRQPFLKRRIRHILADFQSDVVCSPTVVQASISPARPPGRSTCPWLFTFRMIL